MVTVLVNGGNGYLPTESAIVRGGYEVQVFLHKGVQPYKENTDFTYVQQTVENIQKVLEE